MATTRTTEILCVLLNSLEELGLDPCRQVSTLTIDLCSLLVNCQTLEMLAERPASPAHALFLVETVEMHRRLREILFWAARSLDQQERQVQKELRRACPTA